MQKGLNQTFTEFELMLVKRFCLHTLPFSVEILFTTTLNFIIFILFLFFCSINYFGPTSFFLWFNCMHLFAPIHQALYPIYFSLVAELSNQNINLFSKSSQLLTSPLFILLLSLDSLIKLLSLSHCLSKYSLFTQKAQNLLNFWKKCNCKSYIC